MSDPSPQLSRRAFLKRSLGAPLAAALAGTPALPGTSSQEAPRLQRIGMSWSQESGARICLLLILQKGLRSAKISHRRSRAVSTRQDDQQV